MHVVTTNIPTKQAKEFIQGVNKTLNKIYPCNTSNASKLSLWAAGEIFFSPKFEIQNTKKKQVKTAERWTKLMPGSFEKIFVEHKCPLHFLIFQSSN